MRHYSDRELKGVVPLPEAVTALEAAFAALARSEASVQMRFTTASGALQLSTMAAILPSSGYCASKVYTRIGNQYSFVILLFSAEDGRLLATFDAGELTKLRTAAVSCLAARYMARPEARTLVVFGAGRQAEAHLTALPGMFAFESIQVVSRGDAREFVERIGAEIGRPITQVAAEDALPKADIIVTATRSAVPLFRGELLQEGCFISAVGSSVPQNAEIGTDTIRRCNRIAVEAIDHAQHEAGDLIQAAAAGALRWDAVMTLGDLAIGRAPGRDSDREITFFKSVGCALEDVAVAAIAYEKISA